jgi:hypothetical protein
VSPHGSGKKRAQEKDTDILFHTLLLKCECGRLLGKVMRDGSGRMPTRLDPE